MKYADLHVHTHFSDSTFSPEDVVRTAKERALAAVAICDHDCTDGIEPTQRAGAEEGIEIIPAVEITIDNADDEVHMVGYFIDWKLDWLQKKFSEIRESRKNRIFTIVEKLKGQGIDIKTEDVFAMAGKGTIGRMHIAKAIINAGKVKTFKEVFDKYLGFDKPCYVGHICFSVDEAMDSILKAGGVPVLAHPAVMKIPDKDEYIIELITKGLRGIEVYHSDHRNSDSRHFEEMAKRYGLITTGGSDCHGLGKGKALIGTVRVPYKIVDMLKKESEKIRHENR